MCRLSLFWLDTGYPAIYPVRILIYHNLPVFQEAEGEEDEDSLRGGDRGEVLHLDACHPSRVPPIQPARDTVPQER